MFDLKSFIVRNLVNGVKNGTFTREYANITAVNYLSKGMLVEENLIDIDSQIAEWETAQNATNEPVSDAVKEVTTEEETTAESSQEEATDGITESVVESVESTEEVTE